MRNGAREILEMAPQGHRRNGKRMLNRALDDLEVVLDQMETES